ncbi:hypothetical protein SAMN05443429_101133 [Cruoricaptor ignavus]|uniref:Uncharacterized protein n=1 Tax=Cruoricaptor ignavus TaxID=1118202 RepID=A0A1M6A3U8_9FLAO|nr:DUF2683 family protein [Cruoricaptor ignavus]QOR74687.1 hypothetical protein IMZ16_04455 [Cruoricaptor ignavus]SHI31136.1 hypothetical protein SAMN05443429_101133 [Cruoricaptor ignavus]
METITIKIDRRTKHGKAFRDVLEVYAQQDGVEIVKKNGYSKEFIEKMKRAEDDIKNGRGIKVDINDVWKNIL